LLKANQLPPIPKKRLRNEKTIRKYHNKVV
jgi:hypothetical protein